MSNSQQPAFQVYVVTKRENQDDWWCNVGAAFAHQDGLGFNVLLSALPTNGKLVLRPVKEANGDTPPREKETPARRSERRGR